MPPRLRRTLQALILAGLGLLLLQKLWSGTLNWYLNDRFLALVLAAALACLALAGVALPPWRPATGTGGSHPPTGSSPQGGQRDSVWPLVIVALPLLLGVLLPAHPLESGALAYKGLNAPTTLAGPGGGAWGQPGRGAPTLLDWARAFHAAGNPRDLAGQRVDVIGFVYHDPALAAGEFMVARFAAYCCAAEAAGVGLRVQWPHAAALEANAWVRVVGPVRVVTSAGQPTPVIVAESVTGIEAPAQPYLYP